VKSVLLPLRAGVCWNDTFSKSNVSTEAERELTIGCAATVTDRVYRSIGGSFHSFHSFHSLHRFTANSMSCNERKELSAPGRLKHPLTKLHLSHGFDGFHEVGAVR
jgi:hypothetical protein